MRNLTKMFLAGGLLALAPLAWAQQRPRPDDARPEAAGDLTSRMMAFDANKDGKIQEAELTDARLKRLFDRADADKDQVVTADELKALAAREQVADRGPGGPGGGPGGPGGPGGGPGGPRMGPPGRVGEVLPAMFRQRLNLTAVQEKDLAELQSYVDGKLEKILDDDQKRQLKQARDRGPGGPPPGRGGRPGDGPPPPR